MIKLEFDGQDPTALKHLGQALVNMANEMTGTVVTDADKFVTATAVGNVPKGVMVVQVDEAKPVTVSQAEVESNPKYDANGLPWDERIHSGSKARNKDDTWKKRKGVDDATVAAVTEELQALMSIPVEEPVDPKSEQVVNDVETQQADVTASQPEDEQGASIEDITNAEIQAGNIAADAPPPPPPINHDSIVSADPAIGVVTIPKSEATSQDAPPPPPPPVTSVADAGNTQVDVEVSVKFVDITKFITGTIVKNGVKSMPEVTAAITAEYGVPFPALAKREDLWPQVMAFLEKMNNEANTK